MMPVVTEYNFVRILSVGEKSTDPVQYTLADDRMMGHKLRVFTMDGNAKEEAMKQLKGMLKCLEDLK